MALKIRLSRAGARNSPFYRIVVAEARFPRDGRFVEKVGYYDPKKKPTVINLNYERLDYWLHKGAIPTDTVARLIKTAKRSAPASGNVETPSGDNADAGA